jgi:hypothetical protein
LAAKLLFFKKFTKNFEAVKKILLFILCALLSRISFGQTSQTSTAIPDSYKTALFQSLKNTLYATEGLLALKAASLINSQTNDCTQFSSDGICTQLGARYAELSSPKISSKSIILNGAYLVSDRWRLGAYIDAGNITSQPSFTYVKQNGNDPILGAYSVYSDKIGNQAFSLKLGANVGSTSVDVSTPNIGSLGSLSRTINIKAQSYLALINTQLAIHPKAALMPYLGTTYTAMKIDGGNNNSSRLSNLPIIFDGVSTDVFALQAGLNSVFRPIETLTLSASAGVQHTLSSSISNLSVTQSIITSSYIGQSNLATNVPAFMALAKYNPIPDHELVAKVIYRQEVYQRIGVTSYTLAYSIGF